MQRTEQWHRLRRGKLTASVMGQAVGLAPWGGPRALADTIRAERDPVAEDKPPKRQKRSIVLDFGTNNEPNGLLEYTIATGNCIEETGFWQHAHLDWIGGSPDGLVGADGLVEIKCPFSRRQFDDVPPHYYCQVNALMEITGRQWCDLACWTPEEVRIWRVRANHEAWQSLLVHYTNFWACVCNGRTPPDPSPDLRPKMLQWIESDCARRELEPQGRAF